MSESRTKVRPVIDFFSEVLFAFLAAWLILGETLNVVQLVGASIVLIGVVLAQSARENRAVASGLALNTAEISRPKESR